MSLELRRLSVWQPAGQRELTVDIGPLNGVTMIVGRSGTGASTLLRAIDGSLPRGAMTRGRALLDGRRLDGATPAGRGRLVAAYRPGPSVERSVRAGLGARVDHQLVEALGLGGRLEAAGSALDAASRSAVRVIRALSTEVPLLLLDQPLADLAPQHRPAVVQAIRRRAETGTTVLWAEHLLEEALPSADAVVELIPGEPVVAVPVAGWSPRTVPAPPAMALARALGLDRSRWQDPAAWRDLPIVRQALPTSAETRVAPGETVVTVPGALARTGRDVSMHQGECLGVISLTDRERELQVARRLVAAARGSDLLEAPLSLPTATPVSSLTRAWERRHRLAAGVVARGWSPLASLSPRRRAAQHSAGEQAALRWALERARPGARLLVDPTAGLDPWGRRHLAEKLSRDVAGPTVVVSRDMELLVRACHRVLIVDAAEVVADGSIAALKVVLPHPPSLIAAGAPVARVRDVIRREHRWDG